MPEIDFALRGDHIALDALLKATGVATSGGHAKQLIGSGVVELDGRAESARARKVRAGQVVRVGDATIRIHPPPAA